MGSVDPTQEVISAQEGKNNSQTSYWTLSEPRGKLKYILNSWGIKILLPNWHQQDTLGTETRNSVHLSHHCLQWGWRKRNGCFYANAKLPQNLPSIFLIEHTSQCFKCSTTLQSSIILIFMVLDSS